MGIAASANLNVNNISNGITNTINQSISSVCTASCSANQSNDVIIIENSTVTGSGIGFTAACTANSSCIMQNTMDSNVQDLLSAIANQTNQALNGALGDISYNASANFNNINQNVTNFLTQMTNSTCASAVSVNQSNDLFFASNSDLNSPASFVGFTIGGNSPVSANSSCTMTNIQKSLMYNRLQAQVAQSNTETSILAIIVIGIVIVIVVLGIVGGIVAIVRRRPAETKSNVIDEAALLGLAQKGAFD